ncbi:DUF5988 family protein [Streptomyces sp. BA2]|uniref:DUF5988 family protein n=1 Tax=Streptomyces sp. BA2 TaxID=436595 RepID=UPI00132BB26C|nr:DUF5988 family protein [Streptomyces sp. BA2]MWA08908.1 hypothetical protein [Streptomyces sp. BA2]
MSDFEVLLVGGPSAIPDAERVQVSPSLTEKFKYRFGAHYEHFVHEGEFSDIGNKQLPVYRWTTRTAIAE